MAIFQLISEYFSTTQLCFTLCVLLIIVNRFFRKKYHLPPRPFSWPLVGNFLSIPKDIPLYKFCAEVAKSHGPVFRLSLGLFDAVFINDMKNAESALLDKSMDFSGRGRMIMLRALTGDYNDIGGGDANDPVWKAKRKLFANSIRSFTSGLRYEERLLEAFDGTKSFFEEKAETGTAFNPREYTDHLIYNNMASICFKKSFDVNGKDLHDLKQATDRFNTTFGSAPTISDILPFLQNLPFELYDLKRCRAVVAPIHSFLARELEKQRETFSASNYETLTHYILKTIEESDESEGMKNFTSNDLMLLLVNVFANGVDSSCVFMNWIVFMLALHQDKQEKIYTEIENVIGEGQVSISKHKPDMPYSESFLLESLRYATIAPIVPRKTIVDTKIGEYDVPEATIVMVNQYAIQRGPDTDREDQFIPERFLDENGRMGARPRSFMSFGIGRRSCPGETAARNSAWSNMILLLQRYQILPPEGCVLKPEWINNNLVAEQAPYQIRLKFRDY